MQNNIFTSLKKSTGILLLIAGVLFGGILLLSDFNSPTEMSPSPTVTQDNEDYVEKLETRLEELINKISGVSDTQVLITLKSGSEYVYASDSTEKNEKHVIVEDGLVCVKEYMPAIEGVAVVCNGGNSPAVRAKITEMLRSVLGIYSTHIYITE